eukprot:1654904-Rhodomonas_salina.2
MLDMVRKDQIGREKKKRKTLGTVAIRRMGLGLKKEGCETVVGFAAGTNLHDPQVDPEGPCRPSHVDACVLSQDPAPRVLILTQRDTACECIPKL